MLNERLRGADQPAERPPGIVAVLVLYRMRIEDSPAYQGLARLVRDSEGAAGRLKILVFDNSPVAQTLPDDFPGEYLHDRSNPGLARRYNRGLSFAQEAGAQWLLLLDQDTNLTSAFLDEALELTARYTGVGGADSAPAFASEEIAAFVPKLVERGALLSPHLPLSFELRKPRPADLDMYGVQRRRLYVYNSGAVLRVSALEAMGGFPEDFWLDYLDHATFRSLTARGGKLFVMGSVLRHELSTNAVGAVETAASANREQNILKAERMYYQRYGSATERLRFALRRIRMMLRALKGRRLSRAAMLLRLSFFM